MFETGDSSPVFRFLRRCIVIATKELLINEDIRDPQVRLIGTDGSQLGLVSSAQALQIAGEQNLDLVKISPQANPPVCKIMDYGKFLFEQTKKDREAKKKQHVVSIKEIRLSPVIDVNDLNVKVSHALKFLKNGDKVKASVRFQRRQIAHANKGEEVLEKVTAALAEVAVVEKPPKLEGRFMTAVYAPK